MAVTKQCGTAAAMLGQVDGPLSHSHGILENRKIDHLQPPQHIHVIWSRHFTYQIEALYLRNLFTMGHF
jgi:hypothetical protein